MQFSLQDPCLTTAERTHLSAATVNPCRAGRASGSAVGVAVAEAAQELGQRLDLLVAEDGAEPAVDVVDMTRRGFPELGVAVVSEDRVAHTRIRLALALGDEALILEAIQQAGDPGRGEVQRVRQIDSAHALLAGP